ncbi:MAG: chromate transporter [Bacillota bacterium]|nr:MAG: chromate transporter [Bacillota bacterium]MBS3949926.1 chromate transporter [Peptococcaceae bacterium]
MLVYWQILIAFIRVGILGYGGGPSSIPLVQIEAVNNYGWMTLEEFAEVLALGNALPGPIATKMAGYIGYKVAGLFGAILALVGMVGPTFIAMIVLYKFVDVFKGNVYVKGMVSAVKPLVVVLLGMLILDMFPATFKGFSHYIIAGVTFVAMKYFNVHPGLVVVSTLTFGALLMR